MGRANSEQTARLTGVAIGLLLVAGASCGGDTQISGRLDRLIGDLVTVTLESGAGGFDDSTLLLDSAGRSFQTSELNASPAGKVRTLTIPEGVATGAAQLLLNAQGGDEYRIPLTISRLLFLAADDGVATAVAAPGSSLNGGRLGQVGTPLANGLVVLPGGSHLAVVASNQLQFYSISDGFARKGSAIGADDVTAIVGTKAGVVLARKDKVSFEGVDGQGKGPYTVKGLVAVAADREGNRALALSACDTNNDNTADSDCLTLIDLSGATPASETVLDATPSATVVAMSPDGATAVVGDGSTLYGVSFGAGSPVVGQLGWANAQVVAIDATVAEGRAIYIVADAAGRRLQLVGFSNSTKLGSVACSESTLTDTPRAVHFGRSPEVYVLTDKQLLSIAQPWTTRTNNQCPPIAVAPVAGTPTVANKFVGLAVQR
ncbi:MAG: hypothetical protein H6707_05950 [Deltaproteobacteria bacterium]|nr:hypothetical protein [Deltaproteobacteria bacterium]